jgi:predicted Zn-dependent protease with MMP-like domain
MESADIDAVIDAAIERALTRLPAGFADRLASVAIVVEDEPTPEQLADVGAPGLFGLYQGIPRTRFSADGIAVPSKITLFRGPILRASRSASDLGERIEATLIHEIAHHFGISDDRLRELERERHAGS